MDRSPRPTNLDTTQLFSVIEQRSLEREIGRVRHELDLTEKKMDELEHRVGTKHYFWSILIECNLVRELRRDRSVQYRTIETEMRRSPATYWHM